MNILTTLEIIAKIEKDLQDLKNSISKIDTKVKSGTKEWHFNFRDNTKSLINEMIRYYGYDVKIKRNDKYVKNKIWEYRVTDLANILKTLQSRNFCKLVYKNTDYGRIDYFTFINPTEQ
jgi:hypothetical protein